MVARSVAEGRGNKLCTEYMQEREVGAHVRSPATRSKKRVRNESRMACARAPSCALNQCAGAVLRR